MKQAPLIVVIYDGINNSVFDSQVVHPLIKMVETNSPKKIVLVSFEKQKPTAKTIQAKIPHHPSLTFIVCKKLPYMGTLSLHYAAHALKKILKNYSKYDLQARGPLAGFICQKASIQSSCNSLTMQARGLLAQEYVYEHSPQNLGLAQLWHTFRQWQFFNLEKKAYTKSSSQKQPFTIQAVSKALAEYLITIYDADRATMTIATHDIPAIIAPAQLALWKQEMRKEVEIPADATVYCYNGSIKPWQCPEQVISYFKQKYQENSKTFLYILTQDKKQFEALIKQHAVPAHASRVLSVHHKDMYRYLAAADIGIMFRESHIVNWVSRPTKALEYKAAGLIIEHNNTVSWLLEQTKARSLVPQGIEEIKTAQEAKSTEAVLHLNPSS